MDMRERLVGQQPQRPLAYSGEDHIAELRKANLPQSGGVERS